MKTAIRLFTTFWACLLPLCVEAFSPYEAYLATDAPVQVGLIAEITNGEAFGARVELMEKPESRAAFARLGVTNLRVFSRTIEGTDYGVVHFVFDGTLPYLSAAEMFEAASVDLGLDWADATTPHPRAKRYGREWLQMEWINYIRGAEGNGPPSNALMIGCRVRPEKEMEYRTLHQTVWPGVVDQVVRGNIRDLCVFLVELDDDLVEFLYLEYVGEDEAGDDAMNKADPINQRWWKLTDACQMPFSDVEEGIWTLMEPVGGKVE